MMEQFIRMTDGMDPTQFIVEIEKQDPEDAKKRLLAYREMFEYIQQTKANGRNPVVISEKEDKLTKHTRGYGNSDKPEDYLDAFSEYVKTHMNEIAAS